jgi:hypothetical protein
MVFPGAARAVWQSGASGGGTGRTFDWSTYDGTNDTAWQQWLDDTSTALGTNYQVITGFKNTALAGSSSFFMGIDNNGTQTIGKWVPDTDDATSAQITLGSFHDLGTNRVQMLTNGAEMVLTSATDSGTIVVFDQQLTDSGKISGLATALPNDRWDAVLIDTTTSSGGISGPPYDYTTDYWHSRADMLIWVYESDLPTFTNLKAANALWLKGNYTNQGANGSGRDGIKELLTTPSQSPYYAGPNGINFSTYGDTFDVEWGNAEPHIHWIRNHLEEDQGLPVADYDIISGRRQTERLFVSNKLWDDSGTETENNFQMVLANHYAFDGQGGFGGEGISYNLHSEASYRSNSDVRYYKSTGRSVSNVNNDNLASMVKDNSVIELYNDETGSLGGNLYVTAIMDAVTETASSNLNPTTHDSGVADMFYFDEVTADDTHGTNAKIVSTINASDSTNTTFDPEAVCMGDLHGNYFAVAWRQSTTAYISIFEITKQSSAQPTITRVADTINLGTVPDAGRMAISRLGNGVAILTCGNYYRIIKTDAI